SANYPAQRTRAKTTLFGESSADINREAEVSPPFGHIGPTYLRRCVALPQLERANGLPRKCFDLRRRVRRGQIGGEGQLRNRTTRHRRRFVTQCAHGIPPMSVASKLHRLKGTDWRRRGPKQTPGGPMPKVRRQRDARWRKRTEFVPFSRAI